MGKRFAAVGMAAAIGVGGLAVAAVNPLGVAGAQEPPTTSTPGPGGGTGAHDGPLERALDGLVADKTLTQEQADKVIEATKAEAKKGWEEHKEKAEARRAATMKVVADALGTTPDKVKAALKDGKSIAAQAEAAGVDRATVDKALTDHLNAGIDKAVADGKLTEERAEKAKEHVDDAVDRIIDADGNGFGGPGGKFRQHLKDRFGN